MSARVIVLVGPKGSGKTTLGRMLERGGRAHFLEVEAIAQRVLAQSGGVIDEAYARRAFAAILDEVHALAAEHPLLVLETTGASDAAGAFLAELAARHELRLVRVLAGEATCAARIAARDPSRQVAVTPEMIRAMHERTAALSLAWDAELHNDPPLAEEDVLRVLAPLLHP